MSTTLETLSLPHRIFGDTLWTDACVAECGRSTSVSHRQPRSWASGGGVLHGRIVNGRETQKGAWPWQVRFKN